MNAHEQEHMWSTRYRSAGEDYVFGTTPNRFLAAQAALLASGADALSVADGEGRNAVWLAEQGLAVTATEISPVALEKARKLAAGRHVEVDFVLADAVAWDYPPAAFDFVVAISAGIRNTCSTRSASGSKAYMTKKSALSFCLLMLNIQRGAVVFPERS